MPVYIIPSQTASAEEFTALVERAGGSILQPTTVYDFIRSTDYSQLQFMSVPDDLFTKIMRNISDFTPEGELPKVVFGIPGFAPSPRIIPESNALVVEEWRTLEPDLLKSGLVSANKEAAQERSLGARRGMTMNDERTDERVSHKLSAYFNSSSNGKDDYQQPGDDAIEVSDE